MNKNDYAVSVLSKVINNAIDLKLSKAKFDITKTGVVKEKVNDNYYKILIDGNEYSLPSKEKLVIGTSVNVIIPQNNYSNMYIETKTTDIILYDETTNIKYKLIVNNGVLDIKQII